MIEPKTPTSQHENASGGCAGSSHQNRRSDFFPFTAPSLPISDLGVTDSLLTSTERYDGNDSTSGTRSCRPVRSICHNRSQFCAVETQLIRKLNSLSGVNLSLPSSEFLSICPAAPSGSISMLRVRVATI